MTDPYKLPQAGTSGSSLLWLCLVWVCGLVLTGCETAEPTATLKPVPATTVFPANTTIHTNIAVTPPQPESPMETTIIEEEPPVYTANPLEVAPGLIIPATPTPFISHDRIMTWDEWNQESDPLPIKRYANNGQMQFEIRSPNGVMAIAPGAQVATWNGTGLWLGFQPQFSRNQLCFHSMDADKNLAPLLRLPPVGLSTNALIVIDPGHGGKSVGAKSIAGNVYEKDLTLSWAKILAHQLSLRGFQVVLTRTNDINLTLDERVAVAERYHADLFISLHFNAAYPSTKPAGIETYCLTPQGMPSSVTREYADDQSLLFPNNCHDAANLQFAVRLHHALVNSTGAPDRSVRRARFLSVLRGQNRPAILIEGGFLSNPMEARRIGDRAYLTKMSQALTRSIEAHALLSNGISPDASVRKTAQSQ